MLRRAYLLLHHCSISSDPASQLIACKVECDAWPLDFLAENLTALGTLALAGALKLKTEVEKHTYRRNRDVLLLCT